MADRAEEILDELVRLAGTLGKTSAPDAEKIPAHLDWRHDLAEEDLPIAIVRSGDEEMSPAAGAGQEIADRRWTIRPEVEIYLRAAPSAQRAELSRLKAEFRRAFFRDSQIMDLIAYGSIPDVRISTVQPEGEIDICGLSIELGLTFERDD